MKTIQELANEAGISYNAMSCRIKKLNIPIHRVTQNKHMMILVDEEGERLFKERYKPFGYHKRKPCGEKVPYHLKDAFWVYCKKVERDMNKGVNRCLTGQLS